MTHEKLVAEALKYRRNVGAALDDIRTYVMIGETKKHTAKDDLAVLRRLENSGKIIRVGKRWFVPAETAAKATGPALEPEWESADSWVLLAILFGKEAQGSKLHEIIAAADGINRTILMVEELHGALNRLAAGGLITVRDGLFRPTRKARALVAKVEGCWKKSTLALLDGLRRIMDCPCCGIKLKSVQWRIRVDEPMLEAAYEKYLQQFPARIRVDEPMLETAYEK
ncbi:MAG TPA: hypothetical protein VGR35_15325 [Tepidisphaeraceae bacterium]|nr:hypothetical protein [Tepidisphaeraceae bacterium]